MIEPEDQETPARHYPLLWPLRFLLRSIIKLFVLLFLGIRAVFRPRWVRYGALILVVAGGIGWNYASRSFHDQQVAASFAGDTVSTPATTLLPPAPAVEHYLKAQASFNAQGMWEVLGDDFKQQLQVNNATPQQLQAQLDSAKQSGRRYSAATYVGGIPMSDSSSVYFYVLTVDTPNGTTQVPYIYVVDRGGKIASIQ